MIKKSLLFLIPASILAGDINSNKEINNEIKEVKYTPFLESKGKSKIEDLIEYTLKMNPNLERQYVEEIAKTYVLEAGLEGINYDIAYSQMLLETGVLKFNGVVSKEQCNFSGIGAIDSFTKGNYFSNIQEGIKAHIQHLKAYASKEDLKSNIVDPRFYLVKRGSAQTIYELTGKWSRDKFYDKKIKSILFRLFEFIDERN